MKTEIMQTIEYVLPIIMLAVPFIGVQLLMEYIALRRHGERELR